MNTKERYDELMARGKRVLYQQYSLIMQETGYRTEPYARISRDTMIFHIMGYQGAYRGKERSV